MELGPSEQPPDVAKPRLDGRQRMEVAKLGGAAERRAYGGLAGQPEEQSLRQLVAISRDPVVWGVVLGNVLADIELQAGARKAAVVEWARRVGADEEVARQQLVWRLAQPNALRPD